MNIIHPHPGNPATPTPVAELTAHLEAATAPPVIIAGQHRAASLADSGPKLVDAIAARSLSATKKGGWIHCGEALPDCDVSVLTYDPDNGCGVAYFDHTDGHKLHSMMDGPHEDVTHWQPLPFDLP